MARTVTRLLAVDDATGAKIMGSTRVADNSAIWARVIGNRITNHPEIAQWVAIAQREIIDMAELRNDFIHAVYSGDYVEAGYFEPGVQTTSATRIKSGKIRSTDELKDTRDQAAALSCLVAHVDHLTKAERIAARHHGVKNRAITSLVISSLKNLAVREKGAGALPRHLGGDLDVG